MNNTLDLPLSGAGVLLFYNGKVVLGQRLKAPAVLAKDATPEVEFMGGRLEKEDGGDPFTAAEREFTEECGQKILVNDWKSRALPIYSSGRGVYKTLTCCLLIKLTAFEYESLVNADKEHDLWKDDKTRNMKHLTGRDALCKKEISGFVSVPFSDLIEYVSKFSKEVPSSGNRELDAKGFRVNTLNVTRLSTGAITKYALRAFNTSIVEEYSETINKFFNTANN